jgi:hypothetical protein
MATRTRDRDELLIAAMSEPPSLEQARASLEFWTRRRSALPLHRRSARREANEMIQRCRERVAAAERRRYGTGLMGLARRARAGDASAWTVVRGSLVALVWALVFRRMVRLATAVMLVWTAVGLLALVALVQLVA